MPCFAACCFDVAQLGWSSTLAARGTQMEGRHTGWEGGRTCRAANNGREAGTSPATRQARLLFKDGQAKLEAAARDSGRDGARDGVQRGVRCLRLKWGLPRLGSTGVTASSVLWGRSVDSRAAAVPRHRPGCLVPRLPVRHRRPLVLRRLPCAAPARAPPASQLSCLSTVNLAATPAVHAHTLVVQPWGTTCRGAAG